MGRTERDGVSGGGEVGPSSAGGDDDFDHDLDRVVHLEQVLLDPAVRAQADRVAALLHPDFVEHGASGRVWDRASVVEALPADPGVIGEAGDFVPVRLAEDVVLLTYRIHGPRETTRSSVWVRDEVAGWLMRFHQGTLVPGEG